MEVFSDVSPPVTTTEPLPSIVMPGQNMSWLVLVTVNVVTLPVVGLRVAVFRLRLLVRREPVVEVRRPREHLQARRALWLQVTSWLQARCRARALCRC